MKVKRIVINFMGGKEDILDKLFKLGWKGKDMFVAILYEAKDDIFFSGGESKKKLMKKLKISEPTYFNRLRKLSDEGLIIMKSRGLYTIDSHFAKTVIQLKGSFISPKNKEGKTERWV